MPNADASLPSARERSVSCATPAIESTIASRSWSSFSFCLRVNASSLRLRWLRPSNASRGRDVARVRAFETRGAAFLVEIFFAGRALRAAGFFGELFFFFGLAMVAKGAGLVKAPEKRTLN